MQTAVGAQLWQLLMTAAFGWCMMLAAQQKQTLALCGRWSYRQKIVGDFLFCLLWALLFWFFLLKLNGGLLRNYILIGFAGGCVLFYRLFRRRCQGVCLGIAKGILFLWRWFWRLLLFPGRLLTRFCWRPARRTLQKICSEIFQVRQESEADAENIIENENNFLT